MPGCPMHEGMPSSTCINTSLTCCAMEERESVTRRTVKPEKKQQGQVTAQVQTANLSPNLSPRSGHERELQLGLRYERPVLELKTDLRI